MRASPSPRCAAVKDSVVRVDDSNASPSGVYCRYYSRCPTPPKGLESQASTLVDSDACPPPMKLGLVCRSSSERASIRHPPTARATARPQLTITRARGWWVFDLVTLHAAWPRYSRRTILSSNRPSPPIAARQLRWTPVVLLLRPRPPHSSGEPRHSAFDGSSLASRRVRRHRPPALPTTSSSTRSSSLRSSSTPPVAHPRPVSPAGR